MVVLPRKEGITEEQTNVKATHRGGYPPKNVMKESKSAIFHFRPVISHNQSGLFYDSNDPDTLLLFCNITT